MESTLWMDDAICCYQQLTFFLQWYALSVHSNICESELIFIHGRESSLGIFPMVGIKDACHRLLSHAHLFLFIIFFFLCRWIVDALAERLCCFLIVRLIVKLKSIDQLKQSRQCCLVIALIAFRIADINLNWIENMIGHCWQSTVRQICKWTNARISNHILTYSMPYMCLINGIEYGCAGYYTVTSKI